jgi:hypothetical protein
MTFVSRTSTNPSQFTSAASQPGLPVPTGHPNRDETNWKSSRSITPSPLASPGAPARVAARGIPRRRLSQLALDDPHVAEVHHAVAVHVAPVAQRVARADRAALPPRGDGEVRDVDDPVPVDIAVARAGLRERRCAPRRAQRARQHPTDHSLWRHGHRSLIDGPGGSDPANTSSRSVRASRRPEFRRHGAPPSACRATSEATTRSRARNRNPTRTHFWVAMRRAAIGPWGPSDGRSLFLRARRPIVARR